jgi:hypothetical protein
VPWVPVDIAHVLERQTVRGEQGGQLKQVGARAERDPAALRVDGQQAVEAAEIEQHALGRGDSGEAVAGPDRLDRQAAFAGGAHDGDHLIHARRIRTEHRGGALGAPPVAPGAAGPQQAGGARVGGCVGVRAAHRLAHRNAFPSPR